MSDLICEFFFNKINGDLIKFIPTEETIVKNKFINNEIKETLKKEHLYEEDYLPKVYQEKLSLIGRKQGF